MPWGREPVLDQAVNLLCPIDGSPSVRMPGGTSRCTDCGLVFLERVRSRQTIESKNTDRYRDVTEMQEPPGIYAPEGPAISKLNQRDTTPDGSADPFSTPRD